MPTRTEWAAAYAIQSLSDFQIYEMLNASGSVPDCHVLHYLQMACEKIAKAYRLRDTEVHIEQLLISHVAFSKFIENLLVSASMRRRYTHQDAKLRGIAAYARALAREIEKLAPAVDREMTPQNAEYPWEDNAKIVIPCRYDYPNLLQLREARGREFLALLRTAILDFDEIRL